MIAVSFPAVSNSGVVRVPTALFFIGKHFGTGVILATAFIHLLPDSFHALLSKSVSEEYGNVGRWVGLIILGSLLTIFLVEYISTTFVDHLHAEPSAPPSLQQSPTIPVSPLPIDASPNLLPFLANAPKIIRLRNNVTCVCQNGVCICIPEAALDPSEHAEHSTSHERHHHEHHVHPEHHHEEKRRIGRRRQIVGIFVLQVGIMIHSIVIGLTLSITSGADFTSLTTAIIFHQIFEGLSLGIRIAALPHKHNKEKEADIEERHGVPSEPSISELEGLDGITVRPEHLQIHGGNDAQPRLLSHLQIEDRCEGSSSSSTSPQSTVVDRPGHQASPSDRKLTLVEGSTLHTSRPPTLRRSHSTTSLKHHILDWRAPWPEWVWWYIACRKTTFVVEPGEPW
ncbi:hypothetical protein EST38_g10391 [Candolleomyces aberdarensis]|uniref:Zinc/iron permease n=1 Tax=Candolleomyces aberdarensis TaxID=2316362 RepID=A0A4Q2DAE3_9AGAR|nr:hypothetical protein EST38_g10391 [Candolleomyces aberdarensis]